MQFSVCYTDGKRYPYENWIRRNRPRDTLIMCTNAGTFSMFMDTDTNNIVVETLMVGVVVSCTIDETRRSVRLDHVVVTHYNDFGNSDGVCFYKYKKSASDQKLVPRRA